MYPLLMGLLTAFPFTCALMYSITDLTAVLNTATGLPLIEIFYQGTGSATAASVFLALFDFASLAVWLVTVYISIFCPFITS